MIFVIFEWPTLPEIWEASVKVYLTFYNKLIANILDNEGSIPVPSQAVVIWFDDLLIFYLKFILSLVFIPSTAYLPLSVAPIDLYMLILNVNE